MLGQISRYIQDKYGSKRGLLNYLKYKILLWSGRYQKYRNINFNNVRRLVFVCSGNICRSPVAEVSARASGLESISFGLDCADGAPADERAISFARQCGLDLEGHSAKNIRGYTYQSGDVVIVMEPAHAESLLDFGVPQHAISVAGLWLSNPTAYFHDPYNTSKKFFDLCEEQVVMSVGGIVEKIR